MSLEDEGDDDDEDDCINTNGNDSAITTVQADNAVLMLLDYATQEGHSTAHIELLRKVQNNIHTERHKNHSKVQTSLHQFFQHVLKVLKSMKFNNFILLLARNVVSVLRN